MSKAVSTILSPVTAILGIGKAPKAPEIPAPEVPAAPAPTRRTDTGASIIIGSDDVKSQRVSGTRRAASSSSGNALGGLGRGAGLNL